MYDHKITKKLAPLYQTGRSQALVTSLVVFQTSLLDIRSEASGLVVFTTFWHSNSSFKVVLRHCNQHVAQDKLHCEGFTILLPPSFLSVYAIQLVHLQTFHTDFCTTLIWSGPTKLQVIDVTSVCWTLLAAWLHLIVSAGELKRETDFFFTLEYYYYYSVTTHNTPSHHSYEISQCPPLCAN